MKTSSLCRQQNDFATQAQAQRFTAKIFCDSNALYNVVVQTRARNQSTACVAQNQDFDLGIKIQLAGRQEFLRVVDIMGRLSWAYSGELELRHLCHCTIW